MQSRFSRKALNLALERARTEQKALHNKSPKDQDGLQRLNASFLPQIMKKKLKYNLLLPYHLTKLSRQKSRKK
jgi:hypothetical protein